MASDSRDRMVRSAALLLRERGYAGTGFRDVIAHSEAPWGSIYHHFPGGKAQLAEEAVGYAGDVVTRLIEQSPPDDPVATLRAFVTIWKQGLETSGYRAGCPVLAVATEAPDDLPALTDAAAAAFARWEEALAASLRRAGVPRARARRLATIVVAAIEGAVVLSRARRDTRPLDDVGKELELAIQDALPH
ncbi:TetR/AcrR family transcriptional regulator [Conexibacter woesei]|uniref:Transcriptional regulator, TetR family n=1 Tax=Conexibacter woesei (strain DSM 14684 / CCUG 47730 / CIP 108061 / JCM 11494 / NBRC 100937 / ID131577) TaxID=469383 RepID=D3F1Q6_CONWI|nr:TetR/AcrR family transcriptional regulator [Conexibacter woesei]ADB54087.1 transcriptional regulator, TetR family [Conexibacter woesei DSM 14684]